MSQPGQLGLDATNTSELRVVTWDFSKFAEIIGGDTLVTVNAISQEVPDNQPELTIGTASIVGSTVQASVSVSGGTVNTVYPTACRATTAAGHVLICTGDIVLIGLGFASGGGNISIGGATGTFGGAGYALQQVVSSSGLGQTLTAVPTGGVELHAAAYGVSASNSAAANSTGLAALVTALVAAGGGTGRFPAGTIQFSSPWVLDRLALLNFEGVGTNQDGTGATTTLLYTGSGSASAISCRLCAGVKFENIKFSWNNPNFTGYLLDFGPTQSGDATRDCKVIECNFWPATLDPTLTASAAALLYVGSTYGFRCTNSLFHGGNYNVLSRSNSYDFNNDNLFIGCKFSSATTAAVRAAQHTSFVGGRCEPLASGGAGFYLSDGTLISEDLTFQGLWMGDDASNVSGAWFSLGADRDVEIRRCTIGCNALTTGVAFSANASQCISIRSTFKGNGGSSTAVAFGSTTGHTSFECISAYPGITNSSTGTIPDGSIHNFGGSLTLVSPTLTGNVTITATQGVTTPVLTVTGTPPLPNVLTAASANFETGIGNWLSSFHAASPLTTTTAAALVGTHSLAFQHNNTNATDLTCSIASYGAGPTFPGLHACSPGQSWTALASVRCPPGTTPRLIQLDIYAVTGVSGGTLQNLTKVGTTGFTVRDSVSQWTQFVCNLTNGTLPATLGSSGLPPAFLALVLTFGESSGTNYIALNETHWVDCCSLSQSSSTTWQDPAASTQTNTITPTSMQFSSDGSVLSSGSGKVSINRGPNAGTGGTDLGGNVQALDGLPTWSGGTAIGTGASGGVIGSNSDFTFNVTVGTTPAASAIVATITLSSSFANTIGSVSVTPCNANAAALSGAAAVFENYLNRTANSFELDVGSTPLQAGLNYAWNVTVRG